jgi:staphylococcal nuclease domain-containing protein 1
VQLYTIFFLFSLFVNLSFFILRYRAKIVNLSSDRKTVTVVYIDYGNSESIPVTRLRPLPPAFSVTTLPAQSSEAQLAYVEVPNSESEYGYDCLEKIREFSESAQDGLYMQVVSKVQGVRQVLIFKSKDGKPESSINAELVKSGLSTVKKDIVKTYEREQREMAKKTVLGGVAVGARPKKTVISVVIDAQDSARRKRLNMWRYGDFTNDE